MNFDYQIGFLNLFQISTSLSKLKFLKYTVGHAVYITYASVKS